MELNHRSLSLYIGALGADFRTKSNAYAARPREKCFAAKLTALAMWIAWGVYILHVVGWPVYICVFVNT